MKSWVFPILKAPRSQLGDKHIRFKSVVLFVFILYGIIFLKEWLGRLKSLF